VERQTAFLPNGFLLNDTWVHQAEIRQLNGYDEQTLAQKVVPSSFFKTNLLLESVVTFGKSGEKIDTREAVRRLTLGDRIALVLQIRRSYSGDKLQAVLQCPACKESLSIDISAKSLLQPASLHSPETGYPLRFEGFNLMIRPATGADLEAIADEKSNLAQKELLVRLCVVFSEPPLPEKLSYQLIAAVGAKLRGIDSLADTVFKLTCPVCNQPFEAPLDVEDFFFREMTARLYQLEREIHWIAFNYHWSEDAILSLTVAKRKRYIELINGTIEGESI
jgi:hypothetical protein